MHFAINPRATFPDRNQVDSHVNLARSGGLAALPLSSSRHLRHRRDDARPAACRPENHPDADRSDPARSGPGRTDRRDRGLRAQLRRSPDDRGQISGHARDALRHGDGACRHCARGRARRHHCAGHAGCGLCRPGWAGRGRQFPRGPLHPAAPIDGLRRGGGLPDRLRHLSRRARNPRAAGARRDAGGAGRRWRRRADRGRDRQADGSAGDRARAWRRKARSRARGRGRCDDRQRDRRHQGRDQGRGRRGCRL